MHQVKALQGVLGQRLNLHADAFTGGGIAESEFAVLKVVVAFEAVATNEAVYENVRFNDPRAEMGRATSEIGSHLRTVIVTTAVRVRP